MRQEPELFVPANERREARRGLSWLAVVLTRIWIVLALITAWIVFATDERALNVRGGLITLAIFAFVWNIVAWIFGPALPPNDKRR